MGNISAELFERMAESGQQLQKLLHDLAKSPNTQKRLAPFGIEKAAKMAGCTSNHIRDLEQRGDLPEPQKIQSGSIERRVYSLADINRIRAKIGTLPRRPAGARATVVCFINLKGGVAKTTSSVHFAQNAAKEGYRVLLVDMDPQASCTSVFGYTPDLDLSEEDTILNALLNDPAAIKTVIRKTYWDQLDLIPAQMDLQTIDVEMYSKPNAPGVGHITQRFKEALSTVRDNYDIIVVDTAPAFGLLSINSISAADYLVTPMSPVMYDIASSVQFFRLLAGLFSRMPMPVRQFNILITKHDGSKEMTAASRMIIGAYGEVVLQNIMSMTREIQKSQNDQISVYEIDKPRGNDETYRRALFLLDATNEEILNIVRGLWAEDVAELSSNLSAFNSADASHLPAMVEPPPMFNANPRDAQ